MVLVKAFHALLARSRIGMPSTARMALFPASDPIVGRPITPRFLATEAAGPTVRVDQVSHDIDDDAAKSGKHPVEASPAKSGESSSGDTAEDDDEMEQEEMADESFEIKGREWGGPRRGGRFPEPTRYGDWERKGRCSDF